MANGHDKYLALREQAREMRRKPTRAEGVLWKHLRMHRLGGLHFQRQYIVRGFIADFYCHVASLVVEVDGEVHDGQIERDEDRDAALVRHGLEVLRFRNERVINDVYAVLREIHDVAAQRAAPGLLRGPGALPAFGNSQDLPQKSDTAPI